MMKQGLIDEVESLMKQFPKECLAFQGLGYKECILFLSGSLSKQEMVELIKLRTRQFAKRQMTWFRRVNNVHWHNII
ncbi:MAG: tRNA dimethylallyltransferase [Candidatus Marinamargulisbacteria bacterium]|jgi:tRNA dimethylallyltransferase